MAESGFQRFSQLHEPAYQLQRRYGVIDGYNRDRRIQADQYLLGELTQAHLRYERRDGSLPSIGELPERELEQAVSSALRTRTRR